MPIEDFEFQHIANPQISGEVRRTYGIKDLHCEDFVGWWYGPNHYRPPVPDPDPRPTEEDISKRFEDEEPAQRALQIQYLNDRLKFWEDWEKNELPKVLKEMPPPKKYRKRKIEVNKPTPRMKEGSWEPNISRIETIECYSSVLRDGDDITGKVRNEFGGKWTDCKSMLYAVYQRPGNDDSRYRKIW